MDAIIIEGLKVDTVVGCFNWERQIIQPLMLDLTIHNDLSQAAYSDELEDTLNYAQICELAAQVIQEAKPNWCLNVYFRLSPRSNQSRSPFANPPSLHKPMQ